MSYIKIHRKVMASAIWRNVNDWRLAETLLLMANWTPGDFQSRNGDLIRVSRGELVTSLESLAMASNLSVKEVRTALVHLEKAEFLASTWASHFRVIKIKKYEVYQGHSNQKGKDLGKDWARTGQGLGNDIRRCKKVKKGEEGAPAKPAARTAPILPNEKPDTVDNRVDLGSEAHDPEDLREFKGLTWDARKSKRAEWIVACQTTQAAKISAERDLLRRKGLLPP